MKSKRFVLSSLKKRIRNKFNVSIAEIGNNDKWQRVTLGISMITNERKLIDTVFGDIFKVIEGDGRAEIINHLTDIY